MRIVSWNVNGIRSLNVSISELLTSLDAQILAVQETKVTRDAIDWSLAQVDGFSSYFSCTRTKRGGYSGVAMFCADASSRPCAAEEGLTGLLCPPAHERTAVGAYPPEDTDLLLPSTSTNNKAHMRALDSEGRTVITVHKYVTKDGVEARLAIVNVYCPRFDAENESRLDFKLNFHKLLEARTIALRKAGFRVLLIGDFNIAPARIDHCDGDADTDAAFAADRHRRWLHAFLRSSDLVDLFRHFHPDRPRDFTCWNTRLSARTTNYGTRIDLAVVDRQTLEEGLYDDCFHLNDFPGSDHCPLVVVCQRLGSPIADGGVLSPLPAFASCNFAELRGRQTTLAAFLRPASSQPTPATCGGGDDVRSSQPAPVTGGVRSLATTRCVGGGVSRKRTAPTLNDYFGAKDVPRSKSKLKQKIDDQPHPPRTETGLPNILGDSTNSYCTTANTTTPTNSQEESTTDTDGTTTTAVVCSNDTTTTKNSIEESTTNCSTTVNVKPPEWSKEQWRRLLGGAAQAPPVCAGHGEPCVQRTVKKAGPTQHRRFWVCARPDGHRTDTLARCNHFQWHKH